ncbi:MAG: prolyl aminopeptidase [Candidatus Obscuribacterales bacterium]|nr:prolyl aminopeptidase [Candidatus Obscuribacterales bacterium]
MQRLVTPTDVHDIPIPRQPGTLYPEIEPYDSGMLPVSGGHRIYFDVSGNPNGLPVIFCHGGPGGSTDDPIYRRMFDPVKYRIVMFDQRGCGKSLPYASLENNTTWDLVADMERLRKHLRIDSWVVFGGSWGSTLALAYAQKHPDRVKALALRGIFLGTKQECDWGFQEGGASHVFPEHWADFVKPIRLADRSNIMAAYYKLLTDKNPKTRLKAAKAWSIWEGSTSTLFVDEEMRREFAVDDFAVAIARIECHYFLNNCFFKGKNQLLRNAYRIRDIPCVIINGRYDMVCPISAAYALHKALPKSELVVIADAGHSMSEPGTREALLAATDRFSTLSV